MMNFNTSRRSGFSLLEMTLTLGVAGTVMAGIWQLVGTSTQVRDAASVATHALSVSAASEQYVRGQRTALLALPALAALDDVVRIRITDADGGDAAIASLVGGGYLPSSFVNSNSYGQSYRLYVKREDGGTLGAADADDRLVGLLITTGGSAIPDNIGARVAGIMGAPGGFMYIRGNPASPAAATTAQGNSNGWRIDLTATGWADINASGTVTVAGRLAALTNLTPQNTTGTGGAGGSSGGGGSATSVDALTDGATDYASKYNLFMGDSAGSQVGSGTYNTGIGYEAMRYSNATPVTGYNTAFGYKALWAYPWGTPTGVFNSVAIGPNAMDDFNSGSRNVAVGPSATGNIIGGNDRTTVGYMAGNSSGGDDVTVIGAWAGASTSGGSTSTGSTVVGSASGRWELGLYNTLVGAYIGWNNANTGSYNTALGYEALWQTLGTAEYNIAVGFRAGNLITSGTNNILIGYDVDVPAATDTYRLNIGNYIYGNFSTSQINLGNPSLTTGISFDMSATDSTRMPVGTTAQRPTCDATTEGAQRWNTTLAMAEFCNGTAWVQQVVPAAGSTPTAPTGIGYIVLSKTTWDGNLGGHNGADAKCYSDLTTYDWMGKAAATAAGQVTQEKIQAMLFTRDYACNDAAFFPVRNATYYYAVADSPATGGASVTIDADGTWFADNVAWSGATYFGGTYDYWHRSSNCSNDNYSCTDWTSAAAGRRACTGRTNSAANRDCQATPTCNNVKHLVCFVHP